MLCFLLSKDAQPVFEIVQVGVATFQPALAARGVECTTSVQNASVVKDDALTLFENELQSMVRLVDGLTESLQSANEGPEVSV